MNLESGGAGGGVVPALTIEVEHTGVVSSIRLFHRFEPELSRLDEDVVFLQRLTFLKHGHTHTCTQTHTHVG